MTISRLAGLLILLVGVILQPVGWMFSHWYTLVSFVAIMVGVFLLLRDRDLEGSGSDSSPLRLTGREMPGDIHGYSGQLSGGRSTAWESSHSSEGGGSEGGGGGD